MWNDCGNALVITTCAMRHAILTKEKNVWIQWISEQPGKNHNFGQLAYVKPFVPYRLCLTNGGPYQRLTGPSIIRRLSILTTSTALRQEDRPPGAQCRVVGWRLEWRTSLLAAKMCTSQGIAISSLRWRSFQAGNWYPWEVPIWAAKWGSSLQSTTRTWNQEGASAWIFSRCHLMALGNPQWISPVFSPACRS